VLLAELLDLLVLHGGAATRDHVVVRHPLQPWSHRYRSGVDERLFTYHRGRLPAVGERVEESPWFTGEAKVPPELAGDELSLEMLLEFWKHPCRFFLKHVCRMQVRGEDDAEDTTEPFAIDALQRWRIHDQLVQRAGRDAAAGDRLAFTRASGMLPPFGHGDAVFADLDEEVGAFLRAREAYGPTADRALRVPCEGGTLHGTVAGVTDGHLVVARMAGVRMKDKLRGLVLHAAVAVARSLGEAWPARTVVLGRDDLVEFKPLAPGTAREALDMLVYGFRLGVRAPLPFFPETSHAYGSAMVKSHDETAARNAARTKWQPKFGSPVPSDSEDAANVLCMRGREALATPEFAPWAEHIAKLLHECTGHA
jgi:exodeoxyribonuclease V gamma subunit